MLQLGLIEAQEYSITSDKIEINTDIDRIIYEDNVSFESENVTFKADKLIVIESTDEFYATGTPIKISFFDGYEFIEGEAAKAFAASPSINSYPSKKLILIGVPVA